MDLVILVSFDGQIDEVRFRQLTNPRSADTGLRYARLLKRYLRSTVDSQTCFGASEVGRFVEKLVREGAGFRTPQAFLYALDFYAVIFGFPFKKEDFLRWKWMADDYSRTAPAEEPSSFCGRALHALLGASGACGGPSGGPQDHSREAPTVRAGLTTSTDPCKGPGY